MERRGESLAFKKSSRTTHWKNKSVPGEGYSSLWPPAVMWDIELRCPLAEKSQEGRICQLRPGPKPSPAGKK